VFFPIPAAFDYIGPIFEVGALICAFFAGYIVGGIVQR
jgi:hypothetical protein